MQLTPASYISVQLKYGCGDPNCRNEHCRSSSSFIHGEHCDLADNKAVSQLAKQIATDHEDAAVCPITLSRILSLWLKSIDLLPNAAKIPLEHFSWRYGNPAQLNCNGNLISMMEELERIKLVSIDSCISFQILTTMIKGQITSFEGLSEFLFHNLTFPQAVVAARRFFETIMSMEEKRAKESVRSEHASGTTIVSVAGPGMDLLQTFAECVDSLSSILEVDPEHILNQTRAIDAIVVLLTLPPKILFGTQHLFLSICNIVHKLSKGSLQVLRLALESFCTVFQQNGLAEYTSNPEQLEALRSSEIFSPTSQLKKLVELSKNYISRYLLVCEKPRSVVNIESLLSSKDELSQILHFLSIVHALNFGTSYETDMFNSDMVKQDADLELSTDDLNRRPEVKTRFVPESLFLLEYINSPSYSLVLELKYWLLHFEKLMTETEYCNVTDGILYSRDETSGLSTLAAMVYDDEFVCKRAEDSLARANSACRLMLTSADLSIEELKYKERSRELELLTLMVHGPIDYRTRISQIKDPVYTNDMFTFLQCPFLLGPATKVEVLRLECCYEDLLQIGTVIYPNRFNIFYDTLDHIIGHSEEDETSWRSITNRSFLRRPLRIAFDGEEGIDQGGLRTEFFNLICEEMFSKSLELFEENEATHGFYFNRKNSTVQEDTEEWVKLSKNYCFAGMVIGMCLLNRVTVTSHFPRVLYKKLLGYKGTFEDLEDYDFSLYAGLCNLYNYAQRIKSGENLPSMQDTYCLTFTVTGPDGKQVPLIEGGEDTYVDEHNVTGYLKAYANYILNDSIERQFTDFADGFGLLVRSRALTLFTPTDLELVLCGEPYLDFKALRQNTKYDEPFSPSHQVIKWFWDIVLNDMSQEQRKALLKFVWGSARAPVGGLGNLKFKIVLNGDDDKFLPTSHTCFGILMLPNYSSKDVLQDRLFKAIQYNEGFGLK